MKRNTTRFLVMFFALFMLRLAAPRAAAGQVSSQAAKVNVSMNVAESITIQPSVQTLAGFVYNASSGTTDQKTFQLTTSWNLAPGHTAMDANFWFSTPTAALTDGAGHNIPSSEFYLQVDAGTMQACNFNGAADVPAATAGGTCNAGISYPISTQLTGSQTDTMTVELQGLPTNLSPANYTGVLNVQAGAN